MSAVVAVVPSERVAGKAYTLTRDDAGAIACECPSFEYSTATPPTCKHIEHWRIRELSSPDATPLHTFTGRQFFPLSPRLADIRIEDIAHALSMQCRFGGHLRSFYSVGQHSVLVSQLCAPEDALHGLLHDASEAYLMDIPRPVKHLPVMAAYRQAETVLQAAILRRFAVRAGMPATVKRADDALLINEAHDLFAVVPAWAATGERLPLDPIVGWPPADAECAFLARFRELRRHAKAGGETGR